MTDPFASLEATLDQVWRRLAEGVSDRHAPARHPVLATSGTRGGEARIVVLRGADRAGETLTVHTDTASAKVAELRANPNATLLIWDDAARFQIRLRVTISIHQADAEAWARIPETGRAVYGGVPLPGSAVASPSHVAPASDRDRFAVLLAEIREIETLHLANPHRRALFRRGQGSWLAP